MHFSDGREQGIQGYPMRKGPENIIRYMIHIRRAQVSDKPLLERGSINISIPGTDYV